jgi:ribosomal protein L22
MEKEIDKMSVAEVFTYNALNSSSPITMVRNICNLIKHVFNERGADEISSALEQAKRNAEAKGLVEEVNALVQLQQTFELVNKKKELVV